jgi:hypothetical protein
MRQIIAVNLTTAHIEKNGLIIDNLGPGYGSHVHTSFPTFLGGLIRKSRGERR